MYYCEGKGSENSFELCGEFKGKLIQKLMQPLGVSSLVSERVRSQNVTFPQRLAESSVLEYFRTQLIGITDDNAIVNFVNEFLEDFIKVVARSIDKDPALIRRFLADRKTSEDSEENKEDATIWDPKGMIPVIFSRVKNHVPAKSFMYGTILDLTRVICMVEEAKNFLTE